MDVTNTWYIRISCIAFNKVCFTVTVLFEFPAESLDARLLIIHGYQRNIPVSHSQSGHTIDAVWINQTALVHE